MTADPNNIVRRETILHIGVEMLSDMDAEIAALEAEQAKYTRIKSCMMQQLLTGKTRLK